MKRSMSVLLIVLMLGLCLPLCAAANDVTVLLNGTELAFSDQPPVIISGRTMVPFRAIFNALGAEVDWNPEVQGVYGMFKKGSFERVISLSIGSREVLICDKTDGATIRTNVLFSDVLPMIQNGRTLVPLRIISEALGAAVDWNGDTRTVTIETSDPFLEYEGVTEEAISGLVTSLHGIREFTVSADALLTPAENADFISDVISDAAANFENAATLYSESGSALYRVLTPEEWKAEFESAATGTVFAALSDDGYHIVQSVDITQIMPMARARAYAELLK